MPWEHQQEKTGIMATDDDHRRYREACRRYLTHDRMVELSNDPLSFVRFGIAWNRSTTPDILTKLAEDASEGVRNRVAENPNTPPLVKLYLQSSRYSDMILQEFLEAVSCGTTKETQTTG